MNRASDSRVDRRLVLAFLSASGLAFGAPNAWSKDSEKSARETADLALQKLEDEIEEDYRIDHLTATQVQSLKQELGDDLVLFDVREIEEFGVSHLEDAQQISPSLRRRGFLKKSKANYAGKTVVFYCSVGVRSSIMAKRLNKTLMSMGAERVANMRGGLFRWHNDEREGLIDAMGDTTDKIHPYNRKWGRLVSRGEDFWSFEPPASQ